MNVYVVDTSVAIKWYIPEPLSDRVVQYLKQLQQGQVEFLSPDLIVAEMGNILWKKFRRGELTMDEVRLIAATLADALPVKLTESKVLLPSAVEIATACGLAVYDSLYLALAAVRQAKLLTADRRLAESVQSTSLSPLITLLH